MAKTLVWFERELRRLLGFDEVEEIARFALDSFPVSQPAELKQYLEQFLGQSKEVENLCKELSARRKGEAPPTKASPQAARDTAAAASRASDDFWGGGGARGGTGGAPATKNSGRSVGASPSSAGGASRRGQQTGKTLPPAPGFGAGRGKGKVYQKAAAEEDFWGGGTTSGRSKAAQQSSSAKSVSPPARAAAAAAAAAAVPAVVPAEAAAPVPSPAVVAANAPEGGTSGANAKVKSGSGGHFSASATSTTAKTKASKHQPPVARKPGGSSGKLKTAPPAAEAKKATSAAVAAPAQEWSGVTCLCMGKTHDVVTNCTSCGKIACVKEGGFGCSFCGSTLPPTGREPRKIDGTSGAGGGGASDDLAPPPQQQQQSAALKEALERKERLLLYDRTSASRTRVLDDQGDYFTSHNWLSHGEREKGEAEEKARRDDAASQRGARRQVKMSIDIMGRRVIETQETAAAAVAKEVGESASRSEGVSLDFGSSSSSPSRSIGAGVANGGGGGGGSGGSVAAVGDGSTTEVETPRAGAAGDRSQRVSLENTSLRGRAKEVYDVMRANLDKKNRRRPGGRAAAAAGSQRKSGGGGGGGVAESSRVSLWRVQHDVDSDDLLRQSPPGAGGAVGGVGGDVLDRFEPADETACAR